MPSTSSLTKAQRTFRERSTGVYKMTLKDADGNAIALADLDTLTLTLTNISDDATINSRDDQDVKNANNVTVHATSGLVTWEIQRADNAIVGSLSNGNEEIHRALFEYTWDGGTQADSHELLLFITSLADIP